MVSDKPKQRILIIDDTATSINMLGASLSHDYKVYIATNGKDALVRAEDVLPDLILLDIVMPDMDGYEVCKTLKEKEKTRNIPIIFISAKASLDDESQGLALGAVDYIRKPFNLPIVKSRVHTHLSLQQARENAESLVAERTAELLLTQEQVAPRICLRSITRLFRNIVFFALHLCAYNPLEQTKSKALQLANASSYVRQLSIPIRITVLLDKLYFSKNRRCFLEGYLYTNYQFHQKHVQEYTVV